jgi:hypothetical protein
MDDDTPGKQPPGPMTLGDMRAEGPRSLDVTCSACGYHTTVIVDAWPDETPVLSFSPLMRCIECGHMGASVRPDCTQLRGVSETRRR